MSETMVERMARAIALNCLGGYPVDHMTWEQWEGSKTATRSALAALKAMPPLSDAMLAKMIAEMDVAMQAEFNAVFSKSVLEHMARSAFWAIVNSGDAALSESKTP